VYLFILESIGTSELLLIGIIALIFLGPRRLPQIARTIGKTMADFRSTTNEFKSTWEREVNFEEEAQALHSGELNASAATPIARDSLVDENGTNTLAMPSIKPAQRDLFSEQVPVPGADENAGEQPEETSDKRNWL
jgi:Tat protein translocase TatB subunit